MGTAYASSVSALTVTESPTQAGQFAAYTAKFTTSATGGLTAGVGTITLTGPTGSPTGTVFALTAADYFVNGVQVTVAPTAAGATGVTITTPVTINGGSAVTVVASPVENTDTVGTNQSFSVATSADSTALTGVVSTTAATAGATAVTAVSATVTPATGGATNASYTIPFTATTAGASTITVTGPSGTAFPSTSSDYTVTANGGTVYPGVTAVPSGSGVTITMPAGVTIAAGSATVTISAGVTNPSVTGTSPVAEVLDVNTNADTQPVPSSPYALAVPGTAVTGVSVGVSPTNAGSLATYTVGFKATTALTGGTDTVTLTAPSGTVFSGTASNYTVAAGGVTTVVSVAPVLNTAKNQVTITVPASIAAGSQVTVTASNTKNPAQGSYTLSVNTTQDTAQVTSPSYTITAAAGTSVTAGTVTPSSAAAGQSDTYTVTFTPTTAVSAPGTITFSAPAGTVFPTGSDYTVNNTLTTGTAGSPANTVTIAIPAGASPLAAHTLVTVIAANVTNPAAGTYSNFTVATSADTVPTAEGAYTINAAPTTVTPGTFSVSPAAAGTSGVGASATYTVNFTASTNSLPSEPGENLAQGSTITLTAGQTATVFPLTAADYTINGVTVSAAPTHPNGTYTVQLTVPANVTVAPSGAVQIVATGVTNPAASTTQSLKVATSTDSTAVAETNTVAIGAAATAVTGFSVPAPSSTTAGGLATYAPVFQPTTAVPVGGTIVYNAPAGTTLPSAPTNYTITQAVAATTQTPTSVVLSNNNATATLTLGTALVNTAGDTVTTTITNVTNPATGWYVSTLDTSTDTFPVTSNTFMIGTPATAVSGPTVSDVPATAAGSSTYTVSFTTSPTGPLSTAGTPSKIILSNGATGLVFPALAANNYTVNGVPVTAVTIGVGPPSSATITTPVNVPAGSKVTVVIVGVTNPTSASTSNTITVATTTDTAQSLSANYTTTATGAPSVTGVTPTSGPAAGGTKVTVSGVNFTAATAVKFGTTPATYTITSDTSLVAVSPAGSAGTVDITVTNATGTSATSASDQFTYLAPSFTAELPVRILDTRSGSGNDQGLPSPLVPGTVYTVQVAGLANVPSNAKAVAVNVTAITPSGPGNLRVFPAGSTTPNASTVNYVTGQSVANYDIADLGGGKLSIETFGSNVNVAIDVTGYFSSTSPYVGQTPSRILDTRSGSGLQQGVVGPIMPGVVYPVTVAGMGGVPAGATSVAINVTAIQPAGNGNLRVFPDTSGATTTAPNASTINYIPGNTTANFDVVQVPSDGKIDIETFGSAVNVAIDVVGYSTTGIVNMTPTRILDTRSSSQIGSITGPVAPGTVEAVTVAGAAGVPSNAQAVLINVTAVQPSGTGNLRVYPDSAGNGATPAPGASNINYISPNSTANFVLVQLPADGKVDFETFGSSTNVLFDVVGYIPAGV